MKSSETGLEYANTDPSVHYNHSEPVKPDWRGVYIYLLEIRDYESAALVLERNKISDQCEDGDHEECTALWCQCSHHSSVQFKLEHPQIRSLGEAEASREEEAA